MVHGQVSAYQEGLKLMLSKRMPSEDVYTFKQFSWKYLTHMKKSKHPQSLLCLVVSSVLKIC